MQEEVRLVSGPSRYTAPASAAEAVAADEAKEAKQMGQRLT
jgi:hypothetical protein